MIITIKYFQTKPEDVEKSITAALESGYRHIDCAYIYKNEREVGEALKKSLQNLNLNRSDIFVTSKVLFILI